MAYIYIYLTIQQKTRLNSWATVTTPMANNVALGLGLALDRYAR